MNGACLLALDQGTTSTRAMVFEPDGNVLSQSRRELPRTFPHDGWVEQDPESIWADSLAVCRESLDRAGIGASRVAALGIANQRETTLLWDRATGKPLYNAIVWQDRRTAELCRCWQAQWGEEWLANRCGLLWDPYFSAGKLYWLLENLPDARARAERGELAFGTVDSYLLWRFTGGRVHATDATNASRTLLYNIYEQQWDEDLLKAFDIPRGCLPDVLDSSADFATADARHLGHAVPIGGVAGDQHASMVGQACFSPGMIKSTYGTGCFALVNTGTTPRRSGKRLLTTLAYRLNGEPVYALEGSIFSAGSTVQWLRDNLGVLETADQSEDLAASADSEGLYMVPAFTGLGAPYWDPEARAAIFGISGATTAADIVRAGLEAVCYQTRDLLTAMCEDELPAHELRVDGGMTVNNWFLQRLASLNDLPVGRAMFAETTALGAAFLAGLQVGVYGGLDDIERTWQASRWFSPCLKASASERLYRGWQDAVATVLTR